MSDTTNILIKAAQAEDTQDLLNHIAWTDVVLPRLNKLKENWSKLLVGHLLGKPLPGDYTKEQLAGMIFGIDQMISLFTRILADGERAMNEIESFGIHVSANPTL